MGIAPYFTELFLKSTTSELLIKYRIKCSKYGSFGIQTNDFIPNRRTTTLFPIQSDDGNLKFVLLFWKNISIRNAVTANQMANSILFTCTNRFNIHIFYLVLNVQQNALYYLSLSLVLLKQTIQYLHARAKNDVITCNGKWFI